MNPSRDCCRWWPGRPRSAIAIRRGCATQLPLGIKYLSLSAAAAPATMGLTKQGYYNLPPGHIEFCSLGITNLYPELHKAVAQSSSELPISQLDFGLVSGAVVTGRGGRQVFSGVPAAWTRPGNCPLRRISTTDAAPRNLPITRTSQSSLFYLSSLFSSCSY